MHFTIDQSSTSFTKRPPISSEVRKYFENFVTSNLLEPRKLIVKTQWHIELVLCFIEEGPRYKSEHIFLSKSPRTLSAEKIKMYEVLIPLKLLNDVHEPYRKTIQLIMDALTLFFTSVYKSVRISDMEDLWNQVDLKKLLTLPYPASLAEQKYVGDLLQKDGEVKDALEGWRDS